MELGISVQSYNADLLYEPWEVYDARGQAFTTFDAYWDKCLNMGRELVTFLPPWKLVPVTGTLRVPKIFLCYVPLFGGKGPSKQEFLSFMGVIFRNSSDMFD